MSLYKQPGSANWWICIPMGQRGKRIRRSSGTPDREKAVAIEQTLKLAYRGELDRSRLHAMVDLLFPAEAEEAIGVRLADAWEAFVALPEVQLAESTLRGHRTQWNRFLRWAEEHWPAAQTLAQITPACAVAFCDWLREQVPKAKTYNTAKDSVRTVLERLLFRAGLAANPFNRIPNLRKVDSNKGRNFTAQEIARIMTEAQGTEWEGACLVAMYTGLRYTDVAHLRWECVAEEEFRLTPSKTARYRITVRIPMHARIRQWLAGRERTGGYVFPGRASRYRTGRCDLDFGKLLASASVVAGPGEVVSFHSWRHTFRTLLAKAGVAKETAQKLGGWTTDISEDYNHHHAALQQAIQALP
jgi:integrase